MCSGSISRRDLHAAIRTTSRIPYVIHIECFCVKETHTPFNFRNIRRAIRKCNDHINIMTYVPIIAECKTSKRKYVRRMPPENVRNYYPFINLHVPGPPESDFFSFTNSQVYQRRCCTHYCIHFSTCSYEYFARRKLKIV